MAKESLKKCEPCNGTGDKKKRASVLPALKQQCPDCIGEGMVLDLDVYAKACAKGKDLSFNAEFAGQGVAYSIDKELVTERVFWNVLALARNMWKPAAPKPKKKSAPPKEETELQEGKPKEGWRTFEPKEGTSEAGD